MLSKLFSAYEWHQVRLGGVAEPSAVPIKGPGLVLLASEVFDDAALEMRYRLVAFAPAPHPVPHALARLKRKDVDVAFVASIPDDQLEQLVNDLRTAIRRRDAG